VNCVCPHLCGGRTLLLCVVESCGRTMWIYLSDKVDVRDTDDSGCVHCVDVFAVMMIFVFIKQC
jgi:hypothetical protein